MSDTILVTGGSGGIGAAIAETLAKQGYRLILIGQNSAKGKAVAERLIQSTGNPEIHFYSVDLSLMSQVKRLCAFLHKDYPKLSGIVFASGTLSTTRIETGEGIELVFATQYLSRFLMTRELAPLLPEGGNIIWIGAQIPPFVRLNFENLQLKQGYWLPRAMVQVQLASHVIVQTFARRHYPHLKINVISPGVVQTALVQKLTGPLGALGRLILPFIANLATLPAQMVSSLLNDPVLGTVSGAFFPTPKDPHRYTHIDYPLDWGTALWDASLKILDDRDQP